MKKTPISLFQLIIILATLIMSGCSSGKFFINSQFQNRLQSIDTISIITDGSVFCNSNVQYLDVNLSNSYSWRSGDAAYLIFTRRGFKVNKTLFSIIGTVLSRDSLFWVLPKGADSLILKKPPYFIDAKDESDSSYKISQLKISHFLYNVLPHNSKRVKLPDTLFDDLREIKRKVNNRYVCISYFIGLDSDPISKNEKLIWGFSSLITSHELLNLTPIHGFISVTPYRNSCLQHAVFIVDLNTGELLFTYRNSLNEERHLNEIITESWNDKLQWKLPSKNQNCKKPSIFYNPFKND